MGKFLNEFKAFAVKGNAVDVAVGVIIGGAFGKIVSSIVDDIIMPPIGWLIGGVNFTDLKFTLPQVEIPGVEALAAATINYGNFIQTLLDSVIIAFCVFACSLSLLISWHARCCGVSEQRPFNLSNTFFLLLNLLRSVTYC